MPKTYDCIVIGSGAGGASFAWRLATKGAKVLILEAGKRYDPSKDYNLTRNDWELTSFPQRTESKQAFGKRQELEEKHKALRSWNKASGFINRTKKRTYIRYSHELGIGGTTLHFQGEAHRLNPVAFRMKSLYGVAQDWPIGYDDLEPYYALVEKTIGVAGPDQIPGRKRSSPYPLPPHRLSYSSQVMGKAIKKLGMNLIPNSVAILSQAYRDTAPCNYCNGCEWGCPRRDKGSADVTFIPFAESTGNLDIITDAFAARIETENKDGRKTAKGVVYHDSEGKEHMAKADYVAVACGAVETPRLLLNSGLNESGQVGKNFMETVFYHAVAFHPDRLDAYRGIPIDSIIWDYNEPSTEGGFRGGYRIYPSSGGAKSPIGYAKRFFRGWGEPFVKEIADSFGHAVSIGGIGEFLPNENTFVSLSEKAKDKFGVPAAMIQSFNGESEIKILQSMQKHAKEILKAAGTGDLVEEYSTWDMFNASHVFGTCRMGANPETSVVNADLRSFEVSNMLVTDASVFPSSGGGDAPSLTIEALSVRAADKLLESIKKG